MGKPRRGPWVSNRVSAKEARRLAEAGQLPWSQWEKRVDMILKVNGWEWWSDRVIPRKVLSDLGLTKTQLDRLMRLLQGVGRKAGMPDRMIRRRFDETEGDAIPPALLRVMGWPPGFPRPTRMTVIGYLEMKTGGARATEGQSEWIAYANETPGMFGYVAHPSRQDELVALLGGTYPNL